MIPPEIIEALRNGLMWICLSALAAIEVGVVGAWMYRGVASAMRRLLTVARIVAFVVVSAFCVIRGGAKFLMPPPSTGGTPVVPVVQSPATGETPVVPVVVTPEEITQGWRLESVTTNDAVSYEMPTNGVEYAPWSLGGGYEMHFPLDLGDFAFPFGTGVVHRLDVVSGGMVESLPRQRMEGRYSSAMSICAAREYASIVPGVGRFWWADAARPESAPYRGKVLTWENVYAGRDRTRQYNAQIRTANVSVEPSWLPHFFPGDSAELTASVTNCHPNAYLGCTWTGGEGIQFSDPNSLSTTVTYDPTSTVEWSTNSIDLITQFVGYSLTNHVHFTVGTTNVPPLRFSLGCFSQGRVRRTGRSAYAP